MNGALLIFALVDFMFHFDLNNVHLKCLSWRFVGLWICNCYFENMLLERVIFVVSLQNQKSYISAVVCNLFKLDICLPDKCVFDICTFGLSVLCYLFKNVLVGIVYLFQLLIPIDFQNVLIDYQVHFTSAQVCPASTICLLLCTKI